MFDMPLSVEHYLQTIRDARKYQTCLELPLHKNEIKLKTIRGGDN